jgi:hypothetical protein
LWSGRRLIERRSTWVALSDRRVDESGSGSVRWLPGCRAELDYLDEASGRLSDGIGRVVAPFALDAELRSTIPGVDRLAAECPLAEIGAYMVVFGSAGQLAPGAGRRPGHYECYSNGIFTCQRMPFQAVFAAHRRLSVVASTALCLYPTLASPRARCAGARRRWCRTPLVGWCHAEWGA